MAEEVGASTIVCATLSGKSARYVAKYRFSQAVIGMSTDEASLRRMAFYHGVIPLKLEEIKSFDETLTIMVAACQKKGLVGDTGFVVLTAGHPLFQISSTNIVKVHHVG
jgi:pyruvate kinase